MSETIETNDLFEIKLSNSKGLGLFAKKKLERGQLILAEAPLIRIPKLAANNPDELNKLVSNLDESKRARLLALHDSRTPHQPTPHGIMLTNALSIDNFGLCTAIFPTVSRLNHSCRRNVYHHWNESRQAEVVHALREIDVGEEILTSYIDPYGSREERRAKLRRMYGFECECEVCGSSGGLEEDDDDKLRESDLRRTRLRQLDTEIQELALSCPEQAIVRVEDLLKVLADESMDYDAGCVGRASYDAFQILCAAVNKEKTAGDVEKSLERWAKMAVENYEIAKGEFGDDGYGGALKKKIYEYYKK